MKRKEGISLIVLVITIVVIVILATAVILSIANNNPIGNASEAVEKNNRAEYESELSLYIAKQYADKKGEYDPSIELSFVSSEGFNDKITSMLDKDKERYIIWQGKLAKRDETDKYYYENDNAVETFDSNITGTNETFKRETLTKNMVDFLVEFKAKQEENIKNNTIEKEDKIMYYEGYITNCYDKTVAKLKEQLPDGVVIKNKNLTSEKGDTSKVGTDDGIYYNGELVARFVVFGDVDSTAAINMNDTINLRDQVAVGDWENCKWTLGQIIASDVNGDGVISEKDVDKIKLFVSKNEDLNQNRLAIIPNF